MAEDEAVSGKAIGKPLVLRHASKRGSGMWGPDDYGVLQDGRDIGRIFHAGAGCPPIGPGCGPSGAVVMPVLPSHGFCTSLGELVAKFAPHSVSIFRGKCSQFALCSAVHLNRV